MLGLLMVPLALISVLLVLFYFYLTANFDYWRKRGVPGPRPLALFGSFPSTITGKRNIVFDIDDVYRQFKNKAKFVGVFFTRTPGIMLIDPAMVKEVLINNFKSFMDNESALWMDPKVEPISSRNPFMMRGNEWKTKRSEIVPGLTVSRIKLMYPVMERGAKELVKFLRNNPDDCATGVETKNLAMKFTGEVVADLGWAIEANAFQKEDCTFVQMAHRMVHHTFKKISYLMIVELFPFVKKLYYVRFFPEVTDKFFTKLTEISLKRRKSPDERQDFLGHVAQLREKKNLSMNELVAHNLTFLLDGFETSAGLISHCLLLLARHPEQQEKLRKEVLEYYSEDGTISYDDLMKLPYLDQVISETLRIFVPLSFMSKICTEPFEFTNSDGSKYQVQKDDLVLISTYSYHHDEEYYPEPEKFIPERFDEENGGTRKFKDLGVFFPFGDGPRICIGMKFGLSEAKTAVAEVIRNFRLTVDESRTVKENVFDVRSFIMSVKGGIYIRYEALTE